MEQESILTYKDLSLNRFLDHENSQQKKNAMSALLGFLNFCKKDFDSVVGEELLEEFDETVNRHLLDCKTDSTKYTKKSHLNHWRKFYAQNLQARSIDTKNHNFKSFVLAKLKTMGKGPCWLLRETGSHGIYNWFVHYKDEIYPSPRSKHLVCATSRLLGLEDNFLWDTFVCYPKTIKEPFQQIQTDFRVRIQKIQVEGKVKGEKNRNNYGITQKTWDSPEMEHVKKEAQDLFYYKTDDVLPDLIHRNSDNIWGKDPDGTSGSFNHFIRTMKAFLGFLVKEKKIKLEDLSLRLILKSEYVNDYMIFFSRRHGFLTFSIKGFLSDARNLVKYYLQYPERGFPELQPEERKKKIKESLDYLEAKSSGSKFVVSRETEDQIRPFLDLSEPLEPFYEAVSVLKKQYAFVKREQPYLMWHHELARNIVLMMLILEKPIRSKNLANLQFERHLYKKKDGRYELFIPAAEVKNNKNIKKTLSEELSRWIDIYRNEHYKKLNSGATDFVFISNTEIRYTAKAISKLLGKICLDIIGIEIRAHAFRHLRASAYLIKFPLDFLYVAELLNDDLNTVIKEYSHVNGRVASKNDDEYLGVLMKKFDK